jgi:hypothetical protein
MPLKTTRGPSKWLFLGTPEGLNSTLTLWHDLHQQSSTEWNQIHEICLYLQPQDAFNHYYSLKDILLRFLQRCKSSSAVILRQFLMKQSETHPRRHFITVLWLSYRFFMSLKCTVFWDVALCSTFEVHRRFRGAYCLHHQGALMMDVVRTSETSVHFNMTTQLYIPEDSTRHTLRYGLNS